jgi:DNA-binding NarL/FixJ family response regulator
VTRILTAHGVATRTGLLASLNELPPEPRCPDDLTPRQCEVAALIAAGKANSDIAADLGISLRSVETHISSIFDRWQSASRFDVASRWWTLQLDAG